MHSMQPVKNAGKLKYASFARSSNPFRGRVLFTIHRWTQIVHLVQNWTRPSVTFAKSKVSSSLAKCWEWSQNLSQVCKWHSWEANCKDFLLRAQTYTFILLPRAEQSRLSDPALCLIPAVVDLLPKSANQARQEIGNQAEIGTFGLEICISISKGKSHWRSRNKDLVRAQITGFVQFHINETGIGLYIPLLLKIQITFASFIG